MVPFPIPQVNGMGWERELRGGNDTLRDTDLKNIALEVSVFYR